jgi:hypothetical protein
MRIATYNIEWFTGLFDDKDRLLRDGEWSSRHNVTRREQADALGQVFGAMDADAIMVIEAPDASRNRNTLKALMNFADHYGLRANAAVMGFVNDTQQEIALLFDPAVLRAEHAPHPATPVLARFDGVQDGVVFSKPPFEVLVETGAGFAFRMIGAHLKSKAPHGAKTPQDVQRIAHENRRKQQAQARWLRARVDQYLAQGSPVMVLGDLNDGPGLDGPDARAAVSSVEIVLGQGTGALHDPHARMALCGPLAASPTTSRFWIRPEKRYLQALLDYIMVSADLLDLGPRWRIWHPTDDPQCWRDPSLRHALLLASDHFPVTIDLDI